MTLGIPRWLSRVAGPHALSVPAWLLVSATSMTWSIAYLTSTASMPLTEAALWGAIAALALGVIWWIASKTWMKGGSPNRRAILVLPTYVFAALVRSAIPVLAGETMDGPTPLLFAVATMTILSVTATLAVDSYRELEVQNGRLAAIRDALAASESRAQVEIATLRVSARQAIVAAIEQALATDSPRDDRAARLRRVSDDVVRPLSHALSVPADEDLLPVRTRPRRDLHALGRAILEAQPIRPWATATLVIVMSFGIILMTLGAPLSFFTAAVLWAGLAGLLWLVHLLPWRRLPVMVGMGALPLALAWAGFLAVSLMRLVPGAPADQVPRGPVFVAVVTLIAGGLIAILTGVTQKQRWLEEELITEGSALVSTRRATQARMRRDRRHLARILHGVVQPRIVARSLKLQNAGEAADIVEFARELDALLGEETRAEGAIDVTRALRDIVDVWSGSKAIVEVTLPSDLNASLSSHPATARAVVDVTCEAVNNAILRAGATRIHALVTQARDVVTVSVTNDVKLTEATASREPGLGSGLFDELTDEWSLAAFAGRAEFTARIAFPQGPGDAIPTDQPPSSLPGCVIADKSV